MDFTRVLVAGLIGGAGGALGAIFLKVVQRVTKMDPARAKKQMQLAVLPGVVAGTLATTMHWDVAIADALFPKSPRDRLTAEYGGQLTTDPAFLSYARSKSDPHGAAQELSARGLRRLTIDEVRALSALRLKLAQASAVTCAGMWSGKSDPKALGEALNGLSLAEYEQFLKLSTTAARRELRGEGVILEPPADPAATMTAVGAVLGERREAFQHALDQGATAPDAEACQAMQMLLEAIGKLPDDRAKEAFALATQ